jgi:FkbM family methyltransferase
MKKIIRSFLIKILNPLIKKLGFIPAKSVKNTLLENFYISIKEAGVDAKHIVDIGANHGTWTREALIYFPNAYYTLVEPQKWLQPSFQDLLDGNEKISYHAVGAGKENGSFKFTIVDRDDSCTFKYTEEEAAKKGYKQIEIPVVTINDLVKKSNTPIPDIVKIDAEGLDLEVLAGATDLFGVTEIFMVEAGVVNKQFNNSLLDITKYMNEKGYRLFEITDLNRPFKPSVLWLVELAFVKKGGIIDSYNFVKDSL